MSYLKIRLKHVYFGKYHYVTCPFCGATVGTNIDHGSIGCPTCHKTFRV